MGLGVLRDKGGILVVPGTVLLEDQAAQKRRTTAFTGDGLKYGTGRYSHIILSPQPSDDPNDPLNFPLWRKDMVIAILTFGAVLNASTNGPLLNASFQSISERLGIPLSSVVTASGYNFLAAALIGPFVAAFANKFGKRPVFLFSTLMCVIGTAVGEAKTDYKHLLAARVIQGFAAGAFESLVVSSIGDLYFVHERGTRIGFINFLLTASPSLASIICGQVFEGLGWLWLFHLFQIFLVIQFIAMFLFCPETAYVRTTNLASAVRPVAMTRFHMNFSLKSLFDDKKRLSSAAGTPNFSLRSLFDDKKRLSSAAAPMAGREEDNGVRSVIEDPDLAIPQKKTFAESMAIFTGVYSHGNFATAIFGPLFALLCPGACYAILASGTLTALYVGTQLVVAGIFAAPPYLFGPSAIGSLGFGPLMGLLLASSFMGFVNEPVVQWMARRNRGVYEPEFRLVFMMPAMLVSTIGLALFGYFTSTNQSAELCAAMLAVEAFGVLIGNIAINGYALDSYKDESNAVFVMTMAVKNLLVFVFSLFANDWVAARGPGQIMYVFASLAGALCIAALPIYIYGKRLRAFWHETDLLKKLGVENKGDVSEMN